MRIFCVAAVAVGLAAAIGCAPQGFQPAHAVFRFTDTDGNVIQIVGQQPQDLEQGVVVKSSPTVLPDGREAVQDIVVLDPMEIPPNEYRLESLPGGLVAISGGSFDHYVLTKPKLLGE